MTYKKTTPITSAAIIGAELRGDRKMRKMTQEALGQKANVDRRLVIAAEAGRNVGFHEFIRMANSLGLDVVLRPMRSLSFEEAADYFKDE